MTVPRSAQVYAQFLLPHLTSAAHLVDIGCGSGELSLDLATYVGHLTGIDVDDAEVEAARQSARRLGVDNANFVRGDAYDLDPPHQADVVFAHSVLEALDRPEAALIEMKRILRPGGLVAVASVEYGGLILTGRDETPLRRFYEIRERLWQIEGADPYRGRQLRGLLLDAGFVDVTATTMSIAYGTASAVEEFGRARAEDCTDDWYVSSAQRHGLTTADELASMRQAWVAWSESSTSYAAFAWCQALGWNR
ncbi:MAG: methyltransferase domain-containing protein [Nocardioidaceae bacterium]|nr:methyltransferase domain-containing protein [Nocardioidaceae bacterium]